MIKIKSITDVITNSSNETYIVKTQLTPQQVKAKFDEFMRKNHEEEWIERYADSFPLPHRYTMFPDSYEEVPDHPGNVRIDWESMCNLDNAEGYLQDCFDKEHVFCEASNHYWEPDDRILEFLMKEF